MSKSGIEGFIAGGQSRRLVTVPDVPDIRDYIYTPTLTSLPGWIDPRASEDPDHWWDPDYSRDQRESDCTAQALAGIIDRLRARNVAYGNGADREGASKETRSKTSAKMLYQLARMHDRWPGENYDGSSIRAVLKGFYYNGACDETVYDDAVDKDAGGTSKGLEHDLLMTKEVLTSTRSVRLGSYFRVRPRLSDIHAALHEAGFVLASAVVHYGWRYPSETTRNGIPCADLIYDATKALPSEKEGRHAFIIIGYDGKGFLIQNSWGEKWGANGIAHWSYRDWAVNAVDHWVLRLAAPLHPDMADGPQIAISRASALKQRQFETGSTARTPSPSRLDVLGHVVPLSRGKLDEYGHYHINHKTLKTTFDIVKESRRKYKHILIHVMGLQQDENVAIAALRDTLEVYKANGVYPLFILLERSLSTELCNLCEQAVAEANRVHGNAASPEKDRRIAGALSQAAARILEQIEDSICKTICRTGLDCKPEDEDGASIDLFNALFKEMKHLHDTKELSYHFSAHGFGAILLAAIFNNAGRFNPPPVISTATLFSPMLSCEMFYKMIVDNVEAREDCPVRRAGKFKALTVEKMDVWLLGEDCERVDRPFPGCDLSWPALWAQARALAVPLDNQKQETQGGGEISYLALARHGLNLADCQEISRRNIDLKAISADFLNDETGEVASHPLRQQRDPMRHRDMDLRIGMLDRLLDAMIGPDKASPSFSQFFARRDSLLLD